MSRMVRENKCSRARADFARLSPSKRNVISARRPTVAHRNATPSPKIEEPKKKAEHWEKLYKDLEKDHDRLLIVARSLLNICMGNFGLAPPQQTPLVMTIRVPRPDDLSPSIRHALQAFHRAWLTDDEKEPHSDWASTIREAENERIFGKIVKTVNNTLAKYTERVGNILNISTKNRPKRVVVDVACTSSHPDHLWAINDSLETKVCKLVGMIKCADCLTNNSDRFLACADEVYLLIGTSLVKDVQWESQAIGAEMVANGVRVPANPNLYPALVFTDSTPQFGSAYIESGHVVCSMANGKTLTGFKDLGKQIHVLTFSTYKSLRYWYEWLPYETIEKQEKHRELVRCGKSAPVLMKCSDGQERIGYLDIDTEVALVAVNGKMEKVEGGGCKKLMTIFRNFDCPPTDLKVYDDLWYDIKYGDVFPKNAVPADDRQLNTDTGPVFQYVALWYKHGEPVFGRAYPMKGGKVTAHFGHTGKEYTGPEVGSMQLLTVPEESCMGQEYKWLTLAEGKSGGWSTVHVGNAIPCILKEADGKEVLGNLNLETERASAGWAGKEKAIQGGPVAQLKVLFKRYLE